MVRISCFADEIAPDLHEQIAVMRRNDVRYVELRSVWNKNVLDLDDDEQSRVKTAFANSGIRVSSIGSPIGKVPVTDDFGEHLKRFRRALAVAGKMETGFIRVFSFYVPAGEHDRYEQTVLERLGQMLAIAREHNVVLLHENEKDIFGESSARCLKLFQALHPAGLRAVFDPSNFVVAGEQVYADSFIRLKPYIVYLHIKDSIRGSGQIVPAGQGDGDIPAILHDLRDREDLFVSLEPHLAQAGTLRGFSGPVLFEKALAALRKILDEQDIRYA
jgi:sugar phosphate isomerase/epimerase